MDRIEFACEHITGEGVLRFPRASVEAILAAISKIEATLPKSSRPGLEVELLPGLVSVRINDMRALDNREQSITDLHGSELVGSINELIDRRVRARNNRRPAPVNPNDPVVESMNKLLHQARELGVHVAFTDEERIVRFEPVDPEIIHVNQLPPPPEHIEVDCICAGARVVSEPNTQLELFPSQSVEQRFYLYNAEIDEVRYNGPLLTASQ